MIKILTRLKILYFCKELGVTVSFIHLIILILFFFIFNAGYLYLLDKKCIFTFIISFVFLSRSKIKTQKKIMNAK